MLYRTVSSVYIENNKTSWKLICNTNNLLAGKPLWRRNRAHSVSQTEASGFTYYPLSALVTTVMTAYSTIFVSVCLKCVFQIGTCLITIMLSICHGVWKIFRRYNYVCIIVFLTPHINTWSLCKMWVLTRFRLQPTVVFFIFLYYKYLLYITYSLWK